MEQYPLARGGRHLKMDGALVDAFKIPHGYWEAKDTKDDLEKEIQKKFDAGYPKDNILFQAPHRAIIYQDGREYFNEDISQPEQLVAALETFFAYQPPHFEEWQQAVNEFKDKLPEHAAALLGLIREEHRTNPRFIQAFDSFAGLCRQALNPNLSDAAVEEMIIQHILTERIFRKIFDNPDFVKRNIIAHEIDQVIDALTSQSFSREGFLTKLDRFYHAIETTAAGIDDYSQKQSFLNTVYERFFQGYSVKVADTHGIVYTPQPIVDFMVRSVDHLLRAEFGRSLGDAGVHILDPFVGTGNFIMRVMREIPKTKLDPKYAAELHCNEVMLLPYYIASMNIEHAYFEMTGTYKSFEGICLVDTFELSEVGQRAFKFSEENMERVEKQQKTPIFIIIGNPPYNAGQVNENDNNKNRKYEMMDRHVSHTYGKASKATLLTKLKDPYVKAIRWATDRLHNEGIVAFITNNSFVNEITFDGMRKHLENDFDSIYILDLGGNVRKNPKLSGTTHNVFGIKVGVSINLFIKNGNENKRKANIYYASTDEWWRKEEKYNFLMQKESIKNINWTEIKPDLKNNWLTEGIDKVFDTFLSIGTKADKISKKAEIQTIFKKFSPGVNTGRDAVVHDFAKKSLKLRIKLFCDDYNVETIKYIQAKNKKDIKIDNFVSYE
ncbi:MAG: N-6 DNA methylase [Desulfobaccales bacterium]